MSQLKELLDREAYRIDADPNALESMLRRRDRKRRNQRVAAGALGIAVFALAAMGFARLLGSEGTPAGEPGSPFEGTWELYAHNSLQILEIRVAGNGTFALELSDEVGAVCAGLSATETGVGTLSSSTQMTVASQVITCQDGTELKDGSSTIYTYDPETDTLSDGGGVWQRPGVEVPGMTENSLQETLEPLWPQSSLEEVRQAQELADAGDPRYTWQVDPRPEGVSWIAGPYDMEIFARFLREVLGWEDFRYLPGYDFGDSTFSKVEFFRCAPGLPPDECAPTIDELRYMTVSIDVARLGRRSPSGIWVVTRWEVTSPVEPVTPSQAETAHLEAFLQARLNGEGAEEYLSSGEEVPLLYATTTGAPYERYEFELVAGPKRGSWDSPRFKVRLFAENGEIVVEQSISVERNGAGRLRLGYSSEQFGPTGVVPGTIENGQTVSRGTAS